MIHGVSLQPASGQIVLKNQLPSLTLGRSVVATVLSKPARGLVLVSIFGQRVKVETTMNLQKGQVLNLRVDSVAPRIILKPEVQVKTPNVFGEEQSRVIERLIGRLGQKDLKAFDVRDIFQQILNNQDQAGIQLLKPMLEQLLDYPNLLAFLMIPVRDDESSGNAAVAIESDGEDYTVHFKIDTDFLGLVEATARLGDVLDIEIRAAGLDTVNFLKEHLEELRERLTTLNIRNIDVRRMKGTSSVDMVV